MKFDPDVSINFAVKCYGCGKCATGRINGDQCPDGVFFCSPTCALRWATSLPFDDPLWDAVPLPQVTVTGVRVFNIDPGESFKGRPVIYEDITPDEPHVR